MKGQKICGFCQGINGCRSYKCKHCLKEFISNKIVRSSLQRPKGKKNRKWKRVLDWTELKKGDKIKVKGGPKYLSQNGSMVKFGYDGFFKVLALDGYGIHANGNKHEGPSNHCYISMKPNKYVGIDYKYRIYKYLIGDGDKMTPV